MYPLVKWIGGKRRIAEKIVKHLPPKDKVKVYVEPFVGLGAVLLEYIPSHVIVNDYDSDVIALWRELYHPASAREILARLQGMDNTQEEWYRQKAIDRSTLDSISSAARFLYLMRSAFAGNHKYNESGVNTMGFDGSCKREIIDPYNYEMVAQYIQNLKSYETRIGDFEQVLRDVVDLSGYVIYVDPPYYIDDKTSPTSYSYNKGSFENADFTRLRDWLMSIEKRGAKWAVSSRDSVFIRHIFNGYRIEVVAVVKTHTTAGPQKMSTMKEILIMNYDADEAKGGEPELF
jgi:DNA adenine methylase